ncbi:uncharacterized protein SPSK_01654 [Sporothrix schenckii 1099-18]|uniref:Extracellular mutant protein 11 C-terminal domain-containing protein n=1 Tax=Sporothrix schenckii 1099-18 TaxID=1397361 RepID=A0A0F2ME92_SPOSC|nr:uncharacterized protein SPSK_01654 [Sporothrix schenckii 1099-18]KJR87175.1 hypothetical protein SPSK_01654 [Sporothrix schenckii 1099-18]
MLRYMRSSEPKGNGNGNSNVNGNTTASASNAAGINTNGAPGGSPKQPSSQSGTQHTPHTIHAPLPLSARQLLAEAAKIPVPPPLRGATPNHQTNGALPAASPSPKQAQKHASTHDQPQRQPSFQRTRSNSDNNRPPPFSELSQQQQQQQQIWEESSINSMFAESTTTTTRPPPRSANLGRYDSSFPQQREQAASLVMGDRGGLRILPTNGNGDTAAHTDDPYVDRSPYGSPSRHIPVLKHSKYALRDARGATRRSSFSERQPHGSVDEANGSSPERRMHQRSESIPKLNGAVMAGGGVGLDHDLGAQRSAFFRDIDAPLLGRTPARPETDDGSDLPSQGDEATNQRTPRQNRSSPPGPPPQQPPPAIPAQQQQLQKRVLQESSLPRVGGGGSRRDKKPSRKRRHSPDYDDSVLHAMNYSELRDEPFDHDPARMAVRPPPAAPAKLATMEDRLLHFKTKDANSQHHFFTDMSVNEWDECGDWFLTQFAELSNKIRAKRQAKRRRMADFEAEVAEREKAVRLKAESIERTLGDLRHEGEGMMRGKVVEL